MRDFSFVKTDQPTMAEFNARFGNIADFINNLGNEYVWEKYSDNIEYVVEKNAEVQYASYDKTSPVPFYKTLTLSDAHEIVLSDSFQIPARQDASGFSAAIGCYSNYDGKVYQLTRVESDSYANSLYGNPLTVKQVGGGFVEFVNSPYADAYPPAIDDGYTYTAMGQLGDKVRMLTGSYTGTGTYGASNPCKIILPFKPKLIILTSQRRTDNGNYHQLAGAGYSAGTYIIDATLLTSSYVLGNGFGAGTSSNAKSYGKLSDLEYSWYNTNNADTQMNHGSSVYTYMIIG